jgi:hypothetical protein
MGVSAALGFLGVAASTGGAIAGADAAMRQGDYQKQIYDENARISQIQSDDALRRSEEMAGRVRANARKVQGSQRAAYAAQGIDVNSGSAIDVQDETMTMGEQDAMTVSNNAWREAWGYRVEAHNATMKGELAKAAAKNEANNTLLTGGLKALGSLADVSGKFRKVGGGGGGGGYGGGGGGNAFWA